MQGHRLIALSLSIALVVGCKTARPPDSQPVPIPPEPTVQGTVVGDERTAMEAAIDTGPSAAPAAPAGEAVHEGGVVLAPNAPDSYVVKRGDTLWGIAKVFLRDPWYWPEIWQVNPQVQNPHLIYPGDTLRLVFVDGQAKIVLQPGLQRGDSARVVPRVRSQPLEAAVTTIPYETVAAFMSKPTVLSKEQIKDAPYVVATRDCTWSWPTATPCTRAASSRPRRSALTITSCGSAMHCAIRTTTGSWDTTASSTARVA
jgi:hypothetical protein